MPRKKPFSTGKLYETMEIEAMIAKSPTKYLLICCVVIYSISFVIPTTLEMATFFGYKPPIGPDGLEEIPRIIPLCDFFIDAILATVMFALASVLQHKTIGLIVMTLEAATIFAGLLAAYDGLYVYNVVFLFYDHYDFIINVIAAAEFILIMVFGVPYYRIRRFYHRLLVRGRRSPLAVHYPRMPVLADRSPAW